MSTIPQNEADRFDNDLEKVAKARQKFAEYLSLMAQTLRHFESKNKLGFETDIKDLNNVSQTLKDGKFRLLVLGDMKQGKSTLLNALIGEKVLPADVNPCTAVLTILRYGNQKQVIVNFNDGKSPETLDFESFKQRYTIPPEEAKKFEDEKKEAFPDVDYAVVEYPLSILEKGVEFIDSPGLNDTEARNNLSLGYINDAHAILFVMLATKPCTKEERRYLENYIKGRGLTTFFLINKWDLIRQSLEDVDDEDEIKGAENRVRQVFQSNLIPYCEVEGKNLYHQRVFELNSLGALRARKKQPPGSLSGTGFDKFFEAIDTFLTRERLIAEFRQVKSLARQTYQHVHDKVEARLPLLDQSLEQLRHSIKTVEPEFQQLVQIRDNFKDEIHTTSEQYAHGLADDFYAYLCNLTNTFDTDFAPYQPELKVFELLRGGKRKEFENKLEQSFKQYFNDKISVWVKGCEQKLKQAFFKLGQSADKYGDSYSQVTDKITEKLTGEKIETGGVSTDDKSPGWAKWAGAAVSLFMGNPAGAVLVGTGALNWKSLVTQFITAVVANLILINFFGAILGPIGIVMINTVAGGVQLARARGELVKKAKEEMKKSLPNLAKEQTRKVYNSIKQTFDNFEHEVIQRINEDIQSRQTSLEHLQKQKESKEIDRDAEVKRLKAVDKEVFTQWHSVEDAYEQLLEKIG